MLFGHRRRAAALAAGLPDIPVVVREDLDDDAAVLLAQLVENVQRADLSPLEEAAAYQSLSDSGLSGKDIATRVGVSPGQVSKRRSLLTLPAEARGALMSGELTVVAALHLLSLPADVQVLAIEDWQRNHRAQSLVAVITRWQARVERDTTPTSTTRKTPAGRPTTKDPAPKISAENPETPLRIFTGNPEDPLRTENEDPEVAPTGTPATPARPAPVATGNGPTLTDEQAAALAAAQAREAAEDLRWAAARRFVTGELRHGPAADTLTDLVLSGLGPRTLPDATNAARALLNGSPPPEGVAAWLETASAAGGTTARRAAVATALVHLEDLTITAMAATPPHLTPALARHLARLREHGGYEPTATEETALTAALTPPGAPGGSTAAPNDPDVPAGNPTQDGDDDQ